MTQGPAIRRSLKGSAQLMLDYHYINKRPHYKVIYNLCSPAFKTDAYSAKYMKKNLNLFSSLKYNREVTDEICTLFPEYPFKCTAQTFFIVCTF